MLKKLNSDGLSSLQEVVIFRINTCKRFIRNGDGTWTVPLVCEGANGAKLSSGMLVTTRFNPADEQFWVETKLHCRNLRAIGYYLTYTEDEWILLRKENSPLVLKK
jgi:hypothetical protein